MFLGLFRPLSPAKQRIFNVFAFAVSLLGGTVGSVILSVDVSPSFLFRSLTAERMVGGVFFAGFIWLLGFFCGKATGTQEAAESIAGLQGEQHAEAPR